MKQIFKIAAIAATLLCAQQVFAGAACPLGNACSVPNSSDSVYFDFNPDVGNTFRCELKATKNDDLEVVISGDKDFEFASQTVRANKDGQVLSLTIPGNYKPNATHGQIVIRQSLLTLKAEGQVKCEPAK